MSNFLLEVIVCSVEDAIAAEQGRADRLEIISHYEKGGLTPQFELVRDIVAAVSVPVRVMIRETEDFFDKNEKNIERMCEFVRSISSLRIQGLVLGFLDKEGDEIIIDNKLTARVLASASNLPALKATFHRAIEEVTDTSASILQLKQHPQIDCILTSGGSKDWNSKSAALNDLAIAARPEIEILVGGGLDFIGIDVLKTSTSIKQFHVGTAARNSESLVVNSEMVRILNRKINA